MPKVSRSILLGWYFYDWANSAFVTSVITVFLGPYLASIARSVADSNGNINFFSLPIFSESLFAYLVAISVILQAIFFPIFASIADYTKLKKDFLYLFAFIGSFFGGSLYLLKADTLLFGSIAFVLANLFFGLSVVMYNSLLNDICDASERDKISSIGWAFGYLGGGILLALNLLVYLFRDKIPLDEPQAIRVAMFMASLWWAVFTVVSYRMFRTFQLDTLVEKPKMLIKQSMSQLSFTIRELSKTKNAMFFLFAYLFYNDGVQAIIVISSLFGKQELGLSLEFLILIILFVQFVAFFGSIFFGFLANKVSAKSAIILSLFVWILIVLYAFLFLSTKLEFFLLSILIGFVLGGTQSLSRSLYSVLIPKDREAEYFSIYEISEKGTSWIGPAVFGIILQFTRSYRFAILSLILFFFIGLLLIHFVNYRPEGGNES